MQDQFPKQLELPLWKPRDCTPEEQRDWINGELANWCEINKKLIVVLSFVQVGLIGFMLATMAMIHKFVYG